MLPLPPMFRLRQHLARPKVENVSALVEAELKKLALERIVQPGETVAVPAGSRGIADIVPILKTVIGFLRSLGTLPFLVPAMGSHGGATAQGQLALLASLGITEASCGCAIRSSMETVDLASASARFPIYFDRFAAEADHLFVVGRIKPHSIYGGAYQSGLAKMLLAGLGKQDGAKISHQAAADLSFEILVKEVVPLLLRKAHVLGGLAILENPYDETAHLEAVPTHDFLTREPKLLKMAHAWLPGLPFQEIDVLIVDEIGKEISGSGMDTNVIGRKADAIALDGGQARETSERSDPEKLSAPNFHLPDFQALRIKRIIARSLTTASCGNALGVGLADLCTERLAQAIDQNATWTNGLTSGNLVAAKLPPVLATDRAAIEAALSLCGLTRPEEARVLWIKNTQEVLLSAGSVALREAAEARDDLETVSPETAWPFDASGNLPPTVNDWEEENRALS